jgi:hypothetical protein
MLSSGSRNPRGGWKFIKWVVTDGFLELVDMQRFHENPLEYMAPFHVMTSMREHMNNRYESIMTEMELDPSIEARNHTPLRDSIAENIGVILQESALTDDENLARLLEENSELLSDGRHSILETLANTQSLLNQISLEWQDSRERSGWDCSGTWPIFRN